MQIGNALPNVLGMQITDAFDPPSDLALIAAIAEGDQRAMKGLYRLYGTRVYHFILGLTRDKSLAEDLVSEVFLDVWRKAAQFEARSKL